MSEYNDVFIEQLVKRKRTMKDRVMFVLVVLLVVSIPSVLFILVLNKLILGYFLVLALFILLMGLWFIWYFRTRQNSEYEYQMVHDVLVVSRIFAKRSRKELLRLDVHNIDKLDTYDKMRDVKVVRAIEACADLNDEENTYCAVYSHAAGGSRALFFNPNETIFDAMKPYLKKDIVLKHFYNRG